MKNRDIVINLEILGQHRDSLRRMWDFDNCVSLVRYFTGVRSAYLWCIPFAKSGGRETHTRGLFIEVGCRPASEKQTQSPENYFAGPVLPVNAIWFWCPSLGGKNYGNGTMRGLPTAVRATWRCKNEIRLLVCLYSIHLIAVPTTPMPLQPGKRHFGEACNDPESNTFLLVN